LKNLFLQILCSLHCATPVTPGSTNSYSTNLKETFSLAI
jgi:hypothetical protein